MLFIDLRDRYGITQITLDPAKVNFELPEINAEYVLQVEGKVIARPDTMINKDTSQLVTNSFRNKSCCNGAVYTAGQC